MSRKNNEQTPNSPFKTVKELGLDGLQDFLGKEIVVEMPKILGTRRALLEKPFTVTMTVDKIKRMTDGGKFVARLVGKVSPSSERRVQAIKPDTRIALTSALLLPSAENKKSISQDQRG